MCSWAFDELAADVMCRVALWAAGRAAQGFCAWASGEKVTRLGGILEGWRGQGPFPSASQAIEFSAGSSLMSWLQMLGSVLGRVPGIGRELRPACVLAPGSVMGT